MTEVQPADLEQVGLTALGRFQGSNDRADVDLAIACFGSLFNAGHTDVETTVRLASAFRGRFTLTGDESDIAMATILLETVAEAFEEVGVDSPSVKNNLGFTYLTRFLSFGERDDLDRAVVALTAAVANSQPGDGALVTRLSNLVTAREHRFVLAGADEDLAALDEGFALLRSLGMTDIDSPEVRATRLRRLHYEKTGNFPDLLQFVEASATALGSIGLAPDTRSQCGRRLVDELADAIDAGLMPVDAVRLVTALLDRASLGCFAGDGLGWWAGAAAWVLLKQDIFDVAPDVTEAAVNALEEMVPSIDDGHLMLGAVCGAVVMGCWRLYRQDKGAAFLDRGIAAARRATGLDGVISGAAQRSVGILHFNRYSHSHDPADLDRAIALLSLHRGEGTDIGVREATMMLARAHTSRGALRRDRTDLDQAIALLTAVPDEDVDRLDALAGSHLERAELTGSAEDVDSALDCLLAAVRSATPDYHRRHAIIFNLGCCYLARYEHGGDPNDLDQALSWIRGALEITPQNSLDWPLHLNGLATVLVDRYRISGDAAVIAEATDALQRALEATDENHTVVSLLLGNLGNAYFQRVMVSGHAESLVPAIEQTEAAMRRAASDDPKRGSYLHNLGTALLTRHQLVHRPEDLEAGLGYLRRALDHRQVGDPNRTRTLDMIGIFLAAYPPPGEAPRTAEGIAWLEQVVSETPPGAPELAARYAHLGQAHLRHFREGGPGEHLDAAIDWLTRAHSIFRRRPTVPIRLLLAEAFLWRHRERRDPADLDEAFRHAEAGLRDVSKDNWAWLRSADLAARIYLARFELSGDPTYLAAAVDWLAMGAEHARARPDEPQASAVLFTYAQALRRRGGTVYDDNRSAREAALDSLTADVWAVLRHTDLMERLDVALQATMRADTMLRWAVTDDVAEDCVRALEASRGLILFAQSVISTVPGLLREAGHEALAAEWTRAEVSATLDTIREAAIIGEERLVPTDLRDRAVRVLSQPLDRAGWPRPLVATPTPTEIAAALRRIGADALCYLVAGMREREPGLAVVVFADGRVAVTELPLLTVDSSRMHPLSRYIDDFKVALVDLPTVRASAERLRRDAVGLLCDWAWPAAMETVIDIAAPGKKTPRLVLVPTGVLGMVPWHAARHRVAGGRHEYAIERATISYAPSARVLVDTASRPAATMDGTGLLMADPTGSLAYAAREIQEIRDRFYPSAVATRAAEGAPARILAALPGAGNPGVAMLHLGVHCVLAEPGWASRLVIGPRLRLTAGQILDHARGRPAGVPGPLVILSGCGSHVTDTHFDEVLTPATAFLVAGATTVIGSLWTVNDVSGAACMYMFHNFLSGGMGPVDALRAAQLWMLDPDRRAPDLGPALADAPSVVADAIYEDLVGPPGAMHLDDPYFWAPFTHQGW